MAVQTHVHEAFRYAQSWPSEGEELTMLGGLALGSAGSLWSGKLAGGSADSVGGALKGILEPPFGVTSGCIHTNTAEQHIQGL